MSVISFTHLNFGGGQKKTTVIIRHCAVEAESREFLQLCNCRRHQSHHQHRTIFSLNHAPNNEPCGEQRLAEPLFAHVCKRHCACDSDHYYAALE